MSGRNLLFLLAVLLLARCQRQDDLRGFQLVSVLATDATCAYQTSNPALAAGMYDPSVPNAQGMSLGLHLRNNLGGQEDLLTGFSGTSTTPAVAYHPLQVQAVEACWFVAGGDEGQLLGAQAGQQRDCASLPDGQRATLVASSFLQGGGGEGVVQLSLLSLEQLRALFGSTFAPGDVPSEGTHPYSVPNAQGSNDTILQYSFAPSEADVSGASRSPAWGAQYPNTAVAPLIVQLQATARAPGGRLLKSNWLSYPVSICPKCVLAMCGTLVEKRCARGPCGDGQPCLSSGQCANSNFTCSGTTLFSGAVPDFGAAGLCHPAQQIPGTTQPLCTKVGCDG